MIRNNYVQQSHEATEEAVVAQLRAFGADCGALVREPMPNRAAGVAVFTLTLESMDRVGRVLLSKASELGGYKDKFVFQVGTPMWAYFDEMERCGVKWCFKLADGLPLPWLTLFVGNDVVTEEFCAELTRVGCPTKLK